MKALFASCWGVAAMISLSNGGLAQSAASRPEVVSITGIGVLLPRQAGSKDAPDIALSRPDANTFELQSATSAPWITDSAATTGSTAAQERRRQQPRRQP
jgi:hypothetical protein